MGWERRSLVNTTAAAKEEGEREREAGALLDKRESLCLFVCPQGVEGGGRERGREEESEWLLAGTGQSCLFTSAIGQQQQQRKREACGGQGIKEKETSKANQNSTANKATRVDD